MQLHYRGQTYQQSNLIDVETIETGYTGRFLGQSYAICRSVHRSAQTHSVVAKAPSYLRFRGISYMKSV